MEKLEFIENQDDQCMDTRTVQSLSECLPEEQTLIRQRLQELIDEAPSDASIRVFLRRIKNGFKATLRIASIQGEFESQTSGTKVGACLEALCNQVEKQLFAWRSRRNRDLQAN